MSRNSCDECGGIAGDHTADCPNRVDDRAVVVAEVVAAHTASGYIACDDGHRECYCGRVLVGEPWAAHVTAAILAALDGAPA